MMKILSELKNTQDIHGRLDIFQIIRLVNIKDKAIKSSGMKERKINFNKKRTFSFSLSMRGAWKLPLHPNK